METTTVVDESLGVDLTQEVDCIFVDCTSPAVWAGFHECLDPTTITVCVSHKALVINVLSGNKLRKPTEPCIRGHYHIPDEVTWRML